IPYPTQNGKKLSIFLNRRWDPSSGRTRSSLASGTCLPLPRFRERPKPLTIGRIGWLESEKRFGLGDRYPLVVGVELPAHWGKPRLVERLLGRRFDPEQRRRISDHILRRSGLVVGDVPDLAFEAPRKHEAGNFSNVIDVGAVEHLIRLDDPPRLA